MRQIEGPIYEYACHEGSYGMTGILAGGRALEKDAGSSAPRTTEGPGR